MLKRNNLTYEEFEARFQYDLIKDRVGKGGQGVVYKAIDTHRNNRLVAIKKAEFVDEQTSLMKETERVQKLPTHPNIAYYEECFRFNTPYGVFDYAILDYYREGDLSNLNHEKCLSIEKKQFILAQLLEGIRFLHKNEIIHRDLKPSNILIKPDREVYIPVITDFGISKDDIESNKNNSAKIASKHYASPEQLAGEPVDYNTDLWSFGIIALGLFSDTFPFSIKTLAEIKQGILPPPIDSLPEAWQRIIKKCLKANPAERIKSCEECKKILSEYPELDFIFTPEVNLTENKTEQEGDTEDISDKKSVEITELNQSIKSIENKTNEIACTTIETKNTVGIIETDVKKTIWQNRETHIFMYIFAVLLLSIGVFVVLKVIYSPFKATIQIEDWKGRPNDKINKSGCQIKILDKTPKSITDGFVEFNEIEAKYINDSIKVTFLPCEECNAFEPVFEHVVLQKDAKIIFRIKVRGLEQIYGKVTDDKGNPIDSAKVEIVGAQPPIFRYTKETGDYNILIPEPQQEWEQHIRATKSNYSEGNKIQYLEGNKNTIDFKLTKNNK